MNVCMYVCIYIVLGYCYKLHLYSLLNTLFQEVKHKYCRSDLWVESMYVYVYVVFAVCLIILNKLYSF